MPWIESMQLIGHQQKQDQTSRENIQVTFQIFEEKKCEISQDEQIHGK